MSPLKSRADTGERNPIGPFPRCPYRPSFLRAARAAVTAVLDAARRGGGQAAVGTAASAAVAADVATVRARAVRRSSAGRRGASRGPGNEQRAGEGETGNQVREHENAPLRMGMLEGTVAQFDGRALPLTSPDAMENVKGQAGREVKGGRQNRCCRRDVGGGQRQAEQGKVNGHVNRFPHGLHLRRPLGTGARGGSGGASRLGRGRAGGAVPAAGGRGRLMLSTAGRTRSSRGVGGNAA